MESANDISITELGAQCCAIDVAGSLTVDGSSADSLTAACDTGAFSSGIRVGGDLTVNGGILTGVGKSSQGSTSGIQVTGGITVNTNGCVNGKGNGTNKINVNHFGIYCRSITVNGNGYISGTVKYGTVNNFSNNGIYATQSLTLNNGTVFATVKSGVACIQCPSVTVYNGTLTAEVVEDPVQQYNETGRGILGNVTINGGTITVRGANDYGAWSSDSTGGGIDGNVTFNGGTLTARSNAEGLPIIGTISYNTPHTVTASVNETGTPYDTNPVSLGTYKYVKIITSPTVTVTPAGSVRFPVGGAQDNAVFTVSASAPLTASANYASATLDGQPLHLGSVGAPGADGSVANGSIVATVNQAKLNALTVGDHPLVITLQGAPFAGMTAHGVITVTAQGGPADGAANVPKTGDGTPLALLIGLVLLSGAGFAVSGAVRRRKRAE